MRALRACVMCVVCVWFVCGVYVSEWRVRAYFVCMYVLCLCVYVLCLSLSCARSLYLSLSISLSLSLCRCVCIVYSRYCVKRDLSQCQKRPFKVSKVTYYLYFQIASARL